MIKKIFFAITFILLLGFVFDNRFLEVAKNIEVLAKVYSVLHDDYIDELDASAMMTSAINGMLETLDPYTVLLDEEGKEDIKSVTDGSYVGIGITTEIGKDGYPIVVAVLSGFASDKAGIKIGDKIIKIDSISIQGKNADDIKKRMKGNENTVVQLVIQRGSIAKPKEFVLKRTKIEIYNVPFWTILQEDVGYVKIEHFSYMAEKETYVAVLKIQDSLAKQKKSLKGLILDLRDNPGGLLFPAVEIANLFLKKNDVIVTTKGRNQNNQQVFRVEKPLSPFQDIPMTMLVNENTASASEVLSGAFQDLDRSVIVGTRSFGKGLVQTITELPYNKSLKMTTARYYTPSGRFIQSIKYAEKNESIKNQIALIDSSQRIFKTKNGRKVYSGIGIDPDVVITKDTGSEYGNYLIDQLICIDFFTSYEEKYHKKIETITDETIANFQSYLVERALNFKSKEDVSLEELQTTLMKKEYSKEIVEDVKNLKKKIEQVQKIKRQDDKELFKKLLLVEFAKTGTLKEYYETKLIYDTQVMKCIQILHSKPMYLSLLQPKNMVKKK